MTTLESLALLIADLNTQLRAAQEAHGEAMAALADKTDEAQRLRDQLAGEHDAT